MLIVKSCLDASSYDFPYDGGRNDFPYDGGRYKFYSETPTQLEVTFSIGRKGFIFNFRGSTPM